MLTDADIIHLQKTALAIRKLTIQSIGHLGIGHIGGCMSIIDTLTILYEHFLNITPREPENPMRDRLILSKGHAGPALYATLAHKGYFPEEWLFTLNRGGTKLPSHCDKNLTPGVDMTTGSLGQGLSVGVGMALADRYDGKDRKVFIIIGDGECNEGQVWEGAMAASQFNLKNIIAFVDYNKMCLDGYMHEVMDIADLNSKWMAFGWKVERIDGHDFCALKVAIDRAINSKKRPTMIILDTIKGKGCFFAEGKLSSHNMACNSQDTEDALARLDQKERRSNG